MTAIALDASTALAWCFEDEENDYADAALTAVAGTKAFVPALWSLEVANVLTLAVRKGRLTEKSMRERLTFLEELPIELEHLPTGTVFNQVVDLASAHALTVYDAAYIAVALKRGIPLATSDSAMKRVAEKSGVALFKG